jgi:hypothetical protein
MTTIGAFTPEKARRVWASVLGWEQMKAERRDEINIPAKAPIYVKNLSPQTVPPYGCMQVVNTEGIDNSVIVSVERPYKIDKPKIFLINGPKEIEQYDYGSAQSGPDYRVIITGGPLVPSTRLGPVNDSYSLGKGCLFALLGMDVTYGGEHAKAIECTTDLIGIVQAGGIVKDTTGTVTVMETVASSWSPGTISYTVYNPFADIPGNAKCIIKPIDGRWVPVEVCP